jgi:hypothetical protein
MLGQVYGLQSQGDEARKDGEQNPRHCNRSVPTLPTEADDPQLLSFASIEAGLHEFEDARQLSFVLHHGLDDAAVFTTMPCEAFVFERLAIEKDIDGAGDVWVLRFERLDDPRPVILVLHIDAERSACVDHDAAWQERLVHRRQGSCTPWTATGSLGRMHSVSRRASAPLLPYRRRPRRAHRLVLQRCPTRRWIAALRLASSERGAQ